MLLLLVACTCAPSGAPSPSTPPTPLAPPISPEKSPTDAATNAAMAQEAKETIATMKAQAQETTLAGIKEELLNGIQMLENVEVGGTDYAGPMRGGSAPCADPEPLLPHWPVVRAYRNTMKNLPIPVPGAGILSLNTVPAQQWRADAAGIVEVPMPENGMWSLVFQSTEHCRILGIRVQETTADFCLAKLGPHQETCKLLSFLAEDRYFELKDAEFSSPLVVGYREQVLQNGPPPH